MCKETKKGDRVDSVNLTQCQPCLTFLLIHLSLSFKTCLILNLLTLCEYDDILIINFNDLHASSRIIKDMLSEIVCGCSLF